MALAANQVVNNDFLAAGLIWNLLTAQFAYNLQVFFPVCVILEGVFGGITTSRLILWVQALPALIALILVYLAQSS